MSAGELPGRLHQAYERERQMLREWDKSAKYPGERLRPVFGTGAFDAAVLLVGEAPGREETEAGRPFTGRAGGVLDGLLAQSGICREELFVTNAVKFRPFRLSAKGTKSNRTPTREELEQGRALLYFEIEVISPKIVVTLGNSPLWSLTGCANIGAIHGKPQPLGQRMLFPLYHPASVLYRPALREECEADFSALRRWIGEQRS